MKKSLFIILCFISINSIGQKVIGCSCLGDSDGDGISNCFDKCPDTPINTSVDSHVCPRDTDGDGVADYLDQQLITPTECQPSDSNGIGFCPEKVCQNRKQIMSDGSVFKYQEYYFKSRKIIFDNYVAKMLDDLSIQMKANPSFKVVLVVGAKDIEHLKTNEFKNKVFDYLDKKGIDIERLIFKNNLMNSQPHFVIRNPLDDDY